MKRRQKLESKGFSFVWGYSAYTVCVRYNGQHIGNWTTSRAFGLPSDEELFEAAGSEEQA